MFKWRYRADVIEKSFHRVLGKCSRKVSMSVHNLIAFSVLERYYFLIKAEITRLNHAESRLKFFNNVSNVNPITLGAVALMST